MNKTIAVDDKLANVKQALQEQGYQTTTLKQGLQNAAAVVVSGMDNNFLGQEDIKTKVPVIDAAGRDVNEILQEVQRSVQH